MRTRTLNTSRRPRRGLLFVLPLVGATALGGCAGSGGGAQKAAATEPDSLPRALAMGLALFERSPEGKTVPQAATAAFLVREGGRWDYKTLRDESSNVFHKVMQYTDPAGQKGLLTFGGTAAIVKFWPKGQEPRVLWQADFGGKFSRMRDGEVADVYGTGTPAIVVATHDQGVVATLRPDGKGGYEVSELDHEANTIVHEVETGDLDGDGTLEIYATPSMPNKLDGTPQPGYVVRYVPARKEGRKVVADLGDRHAKEILVSDVDGDGRDELYAAVEAVSGGRVEIRRYDADTPPDKGVTIATIDDRLCRCLTAGDVEGDGHREIVATTSKKGLWLLRPPKTTGGSWSVESIDTDSSGFEHAALLTDLDGDGKDELYVAADDQGQVRRYRWTDGHPQREAIYSYAKKLAGFTWNVTAVDAALVP
jgi:hypothetical protein